MLVEAPIYDLLGVSHHSGGMHGGHYIAHVDTSLAADDRVTAGSTGGGSRWMCFNDSRVSPTSTASLAGPSAYVLFYKLRQKDR